MAENQQETNKQLGFSLWATLSFSLFTRESSLWTLVALASPISLHLPLNSGKPPGFSWFPLPVHILKTVHWVGWGWGAGWGLTPFIVHLSGIAILCLISNVLKSDVSYFLSGFLVVSVGKVNLISVIPSLLEVEISKDLHLNWGNRSIWSLHTVMYHTATFQSRTDHVY